MATSTFRNKNEVRPKKQGAAKRARIKAQKKRLIGLGVPEEQVAKMQSDTLRMFLKYPKVTKAAFAEEAQCQECAESAE